jgi:beta-mannosidase
VTTPVPTVPDAVRRGLRARPACARHRVSTHEAAPLNGAWQLVGLEPDAALAPSDLPSVLASSGRTYIEMDGATTVGAALLAAGEISLDMPSDLDASDWWMRHSFASPQSRDGEPVAASWLVFEGLATIVDVWLNGVLLGRADNMFVAWEAEVSDLLCEENELVLCARALRPLLRPQRPRARWKSRLVDSQEWRWLRTTQMGRMAGAGPRVAPVGPWRPVRLERRHGIDVRALWIEATRAHDESVLDVDVLVEHGPTPTRAFLECGRVREPMQVARTGSGWRMMASLRSASLAPWWPHTHGEPALHACAVVIEHANGRTVIETDRIGFRDLSVDTADGAFEVTVNGVTPFLRGSCFTPRDWTRLDCPEEELEEELGRLRDAGVNCIRLSGCFTYGSAALLAACARHGMLVWQDLMFSVLDYPDEDPAFRARCVREAEQQLALLQGSPCVMTICGSAEVEQQAAMSGVPLDRPRHALFHHHLAVVAKRVLPHVTYWPSTPWGGDLPFRVRTGTAHYFGVGAYRRPLHDARLANVRFTTECLAFSHLPDPESPAAIPLESEEGGDLALWKARVPRDGGASWDFEDIRDHYVAHLFGVDASRLRADDPARYLALGRATSAILIERTMQEFRRRESPCAGALTWLWADPWSGAGWGCVDVEGRPKSAWYGMRRASRPVAIALTNEGLDGVDLHVWNDTPDAVGGTLHVRLLRDGHDVTFAASVPLEVAAHGAATHSIDKLLGRFTDVSHAYRFGAPGHDVVHAVWMSDKALAVAESDTAHSRFGGVPIIDEAALLVFGYQRPMSDTGLEAHVVGIDAAGVIDLSLSAASLAQQVRIGSAGHVASDSYFTLLPGTERRVRLVPHGGASDEPIVVQALNDPRALLVNARVSVVADDSSSARDELVERVERGAA